LSKATHVNLKDYSEAVANANLVGVIGWDTVKGKDTIIGLDTAFNVPTG
jgi:hypothetical protein|tara:strand:+ start:86 stop:232 length:147 start_codon:yes stop_codon:yes gene_type:complete